MCNICRYHTALNQNHDALGTENGEAKVWDKGDGVAALVEQLHDDLSVGKVLVAGDTTSDLPMLKNIQSKNPDVGFLLNFIQMHFRV